MKTIQELNNQQPVYLNGFKSKFDIIANFEDIFITEEEYNAKEAPYACVECWHEYKEKMDKAIPKWDGINILFASYGYENYSGNAWILFEESGELFEVHGSHCSCYGLEGQWDADKVVLEELYNRVINGGFGDDDYSGNEFKSELKIFLGIND